MSRQRRPLPWTDVRDGVFYVFWYDEKTGRTKRRSLHTGIAVEAQARFASFLAGGINARSGGSDRITVSQALDDYWKEHVATKVVDKVRAENAIRHLKAWFKDGLLGDVNIPASRAYADARRMGLVGGGARRREKSGSDSTIRRELVVLQAAVNHALRWKRISAAETPSIELPAEGTHTEIWLTEAEVVRAIACATGGLRAFIEVAYYTAGRRASIEGLTRFQVDLKNNRINLSSPHEDGNQRRSKKRRPVVPIDPKLRPTIEHLMELHKDSEWLFGANRDMYKPFADHMTAIGLADKSNPHILRHSRATHLLQAGVDIWSVAKLLGDTVATVERVYGHHSADYLAEAIAGGER